ncbi:MAG: DUF58 domain-containing protein [Planctomycetaceae bacterium]|nr:DUF58 domain-containing protein [Planctomycetaceae bacterium]
MTLSNQAGFQHRYLRLADLRRLEQMLFAPRRTVEGRFSGHYQTRQRGQSVEFRDYREYLPGDEISAIDWKVYGRSDKLVVRLFEHQSELTLQLLVDSSASMGYAGSDPIRRRRPDSKYDYACRLAASIGFLVMKQHDRFAFAAAQQGLAHYSPADGTMRHLAGVLKQMESTRPRHSAGLASAIDELSRSGRRRNLLVVFSDLLDDADRVASALAARVHSGGEVVVFHVLHPDELNLPEVEHGTFVDSESGERVRLSVDELRTEYSTRMKAFLDSWQARCRAMGADYIRAVTSEPYYRVLERYLIGRASLAR